MASALSTLGLGSSGALSYDVIDQLRAVDDETQVKPIQNKIDSNATQQSDLSTLTIMTASLKSITSSLSDEMSYLNTSTSVTGTSADATVLSGVPEQTFTINVIDLAQSDIHESKAYTSQSDTFTSAADTLNINIDGQDYQVPVDENTTLTQLKELIFEATDGKVTPSLLNVGGEEPYKLIFKSSQTGLAQQMVITSTGTTATDLGLNSVQSAQDASFTYNGVSISRATNTFDDLTVGVTMTLKEAGTSTINITQDTSDITSNVELFISKYNELISNISAATKYDAASQTSGVFQGVSEIVVMKSDINKDVFSMDSMGRSLSAYGITLNDNGLLELDSEMFKTKLTADPSGVEDYFRGNTDTPGLFTTLNDTLGNLITGKTSTLGRYETSLADKAISLEDQRLLTVARLDSRYEIMIKKFVAYDSIISRLNAQFESLSMEIAQSYSTN